jgi:hypothetical protein
MKRKPATAHTSDPLIHDCEEGGDESRGPVDIRVSCDGWHACCYVGYSQRGSLRAVVKS